VELSYKLILWKTHIYFFVVGILMDNQISFVITGTILVVAIVTGTLYNVNGPNAQGANMTATKANMTAAHANMTATQANITAAHANLTAAQGNMTKNATAAGANATKNATK